MIFTEADSGRGSDYDTTSTCQRWSLDDLDERLEFGLEAGDAIAKGPRGCDDNDDNDDLFFCMQRWVSMERGVGRLQYRYKVVIKRCYCGG
jgi:hypothetical protein